MQQEPALSSNGAAARRLAETVDNVMLTADGGGLTDLLVYVAARLKLNSNDY